LSNSLPKSLQAFSNQTPPAEQGEAQTLLQHVYAVLPFELFKSVLESPNLGSGEGNTLSDQTRFNLAKKCIAERKKAAALAAPGAEFEETVVLRRRFCWRQQRLNCQKSTTNAKTVESQRLDARPLTLFALFALALY
jgi:hypothetical protein